MTTAVFWKKTWSWVKHHWYFPAILVLIIVFSLSRGDSTKRLFELMHTRREQYKKELDLLNKAAAEKKQKVDDTLRAHQEALEKIEKEHDLKIKDLEAKKGEEINTLIKEHEDRPEELAEKIAKLLGAEHVEAGDP
tara:strand:- start:8196 stop:8603 length:408 start_codon:yes stop_codon:yes gene_type:complete